MKYFFISFAAIAFTFSGSLLLTGCESPANPTTSAIQNGNVVTISVVINNRKYSPSQIEIPLGSTVELTVQNKDAEQHGLFLDSFGIRDVVAAGATKTIRFTAEPKGNSTTFCSTAHPEKLIINVI